MRPHLGEDDLVIDAVHRSAGHGLALFRFVEELAASEGCELVTLSFGLQRAEMERASVVYSRTVE